MISFRDYATQPPKILCGITRGKIDKNYLLEELHAEPFQFMVPKEHQDKYEGTVIGSGVMHVQKFGHSDHWLVHREIGQDPIMFTDREAAFNHARHVKKLADKNLNAVHTKLTNHYYQTQQKYDVPLAAYVKGSTTMNHSLMDGEAPEQALKLDHALNHQGTPDHMIVYSGISNGHAAKITSNDVVHHPAFLSTSLDPSVATSFSRSQSCNHILKIHVPEGHRGAYIGDLNEVTAHEKEFLLPRNLKLRFHRDKETIMKSTKGDFHIHHATIEP